MHDATARQAIAEHLGVPLDMVVDAAEFRALGADSLDLIELSLALEHAFDIAIPDEAIDGCETVGEAIAFLRSLTQPAFAPEEKASPLLVGTPA